MNDTKKTKKQLVEELTEARARIAELEDSEAELKWAEEALRVSEERFALAMQGTNDGIWDWDIQNESLYWSPRLKELLGYADDELDIDFDTFNSLLHPDDRERVGAAIEAHLKDRAAYDVEERLRTKSGQYRWFRARGQALWDEAGDPVRMVGSTTDITERKQAEEALRNLEQVISRSPAIAFIWGPEEDVPVRFVSDNIRHFGYTPEDFYSGRVPYYSIVHPDDRERTYAEVSGYSEEGSVGYAQQYRMLTASGEARWINDYTWVRRDAVGQVIDYQGLILDVTEQRQAEAERERLQQEVIEAQKRAIQELSTPIIPIMDRIIVMPLIGSIDTLRAKDIMRALLAGIREHRARVVILDITGVPIVDSGVANHLNKTIQAARLKGARTIVTGISDAVAEAIVDLGIDWGGIETLADLQTGLLVALNRLGIKLSKA